MLFWSLRNGSPANHWVLGSSAVAWISAASPGRQKSFRMKEKPKKNGCKDFIRCLWLLSYVVMLLCHEWYVVNMSIYVHIHVVNWCRQDVKICQWFRSAESLGTVGPSSGQSACNIPHLQMIRSSTRMPQQKKQTTCFSLEKNELFIQEVSDTVAALTQLLLPPIGPTAFQCLHVVDSGKWRASLSHWVWFPHAPTTVRLLV